MESLGGTNFLPPLTATFQYPLPSLFLTHSFSDNDNQANAEAVGRGGNEHYEAEEDVDNFYEEEKSASEADDGEDLEENMEA